MLDRIVLLSKRQITPQVKLQKKVSDVSSAVCVVVGLFVLLLRCYCVAIVLLLKQKLCATLQVKLQRNVVYGVMWLCLMVVMLSVWCWCIAIDVRCVCNTNDGPHGFFFSSLCVGRKVMINQKDRLSSTETLSNKVTIQPKSWDFGGLKRRQ